MRDLNSSASNAKKWITSRPRPWVVVDWCFLRSLPANSGITGTFTAIVPDRVFLEACLANKPAFVDKLSRVLKHPQSHGRVLLGQYWNDIADKEHNPRRICSGSQTAPHAQYSADLYDWQLSGDHLSGSPELRRIAESANDKKPSFVVLVNAFAEWLKQERPENYRKLVSAGIDHRVKAIRDESDSVRHMALGISRRFSRKAWRSHLGRFPERSAVGRWIRTIAWYAMDTVARPDVNDEKRGNDYDDSHYVFLSLYTNHILTQDSGLGVAAQAISGGRVRVHRSAETIPRY